MKKQAVILTLLLLIAVNVLNAQNKVAIAEKAIDKKDYATAYAIAKEFLDMDSASTALKLFIRLREKDYDGRNLYESIGDSYSKMGVAELALTNYAQSEVLDSLDINLKFKIAELLYKQKRYTEAVNKYLKIFSLDPRNAKACLEAARILYQAKLYADAALLFEKDLEFEQLQEVYQKITKSFLEIKNYEKAYRYALEGLAKYPDDLILKKNAALSSIATKRYDEAAKYYASLPDSLLTVSDFVNAGRAFQFSKIDSMAIKYFEKAIEKDSTLSNIYMDLANYNYINKNYDAAVKYYEAKIKADPNYEPAHRYVAFVYLKQERYDDMRACLLKATSLNDTIVSSHFWLAQAYKQLDSLEEASDQYQKILQLVNGKESQYKDEVLDSYLFLGQRAFNKKNYDGAIPYLRKAIQIKPNDETATIMLASSYHQLQNFEEAIRLYKRTLQINPKNEAAKKGLRMLSAD
ncbi:MAG: tetratricopeptide repeat protein [Bacteroidota bacterium]